MYMVKNGNEMLEFQVLQALELDRQTYPQEYWLDEETVVKYLRRYPEIYTFAVDENNRLIGYLNMSCIDLASFEKILSGEESDICIGENNLCFPKKATANKLYFSSIVVDKKYRGQGVASALFNKMAQKLEDLLRKDVYFDKVVADAVSVSGERLCRAFGMKKVFGTSRNSSVFLLEAESNSPYFASQTLINAMKIKIAGGIK